MSVNCSPSALVSASAEFREIRGARIPAAKLYLLRAIAGLDELSPQELIEASSCFMQCVSVGAYKAVESYLLCQIANGGSGDCQNLAGVDSPLNNVTPDFIGQVYVQEDGTIWQAGSLLDSSWVTICTPGGDGLVWGEGQTELGSFTLSDSPAITAVSFPSLTTVGSAGNTFDTQDCTLLQTISVPVWMPTDGVPITCTGCALNAASVNQILARCVAAGVTTCAIDLSGGTNAAPTGQGITDKADLITAGNTVTTN